MGITPAPWRLATDALSTIVGQKPGSDYSTVIAEAVGRESERNANAAHIVLCVNAHEPLVEALSRMLVLFAEYLGATPEELVDDPRTKRLFAALNGEKEA